MRNINELIGIIKGISFDRVINETETEHLQNWLDKNRNLTYDSNQARIISLVDAVLEDHIITEDEQKQLMQCIAEYVPNSIDATKYIYELYGIIEGVICDGVVNEDEIYNLKKWISEKGNLINSYSDCKSIIMMIDNILADGVVTQQEQHDILVLLNDIVNESKLYAKINHLCALVREHKNIGLDLIDILDDVRAIEIIHQEAQNQLRKAIVTGCRVKMDKKEMLFISLCLIGMLNYDGSFYDSVEKTYKKMYDQFTAQKIEVMIRSILSRYREEVGDVSETRQINLVLHNAIVPSHYLPAFFDFIFDIYKVNFDYELPQDIYGEFRFVYDGLRNAMLSDSDDLQLSIKNTKKVYKLIRTTKQLIAGNDLDSVINLSIIIVKLIDRYYWGEQVTVFNPYLKVGFDSWVKNISIHSDRKKRSKKSELTSRWEPKLRLENNKIKLVPPVHKVKSHYDPYKISISLYNENKLIYLCEQPDIKEIIGGYLVTPEIVELGQPLGKLVYKLTSGDETIYKSSETLYREFIVFREDGCEIENNTDYNGTVVICSKKESAQGKLYFSSDEYCLSALSVKCGETIMMGETAFSFSVVTKPGIIGTIIPHQFVKRVDSDDLIEVYSSITSLVFESTNKDAKYEIDINDRPYALQAFKYNKTLHNSNWKYTVKLPVNDPGVYEIRVYELNNGSKVLSARFVFCYDPCFSLEKLQVNESVYRMSIGTSLIEKELVVDVDVHSYNEQNLTFENNGHLYQYLIPFDIGAYRLKDKHWCSGKENLWIGDVSIDSVIELYTMGIDDFEVYSDNGDRVQEPMTVKDLRTHYEISVGFLLSYKQSAKYVNIVFRREGKAVSTILCYNKCVFNERATFIDFDCREAICHICPSFEGKGKVEIEIKDNKGNIVFNQSGINSGETIDVPDLESFVDYEIAFYEKTGGLLGLHKEIIWNVKRRFAALKDFPGRYFRIDHVLYDYYDKHKNKLVRISQEFSRVYVRFTAMNENGTLVGEIVASTQKGLFRMFNVNPVEVEICGEGNNGKMELAITKDGDGLFFDSIHTSVMNATECHDAPDIFSYTIDLNGVKHI